MTETEKNHVVALGLVCGDAMERAFDIYLKGEKSEFVGQFKKAYNDLQRSIKATKYYASIFNEMIIGGYISKTKCGFQCFDDLREDSDALIRFKLRADNLADLGVTHDAIENSLKIMQNERRERCAYQRGGYREIQNYKTQIIMKDYSITYHETMEQGLRLWRGKFCTLRLYVTNEWNILPHFSIVKRTRLQWRFEFLILGLANTMPY